MTQEPTLLAHLVPRLTSQVENAATDAPAFILNSSAACRVALDRFIWDGDFGPEPITRVETQVTYEDGSQPDMVGYDQGGSKRLLVESKFWASLLGREVPVSREKMRDVMPLLTDHINPGTFTVPIHLRVGVEYRRVVLDVVWQLKRISATVENL